MLVDMDTEDRVKYKSFESFDEKDLALVVHQIARRMLVLRPNTPDIGFWHSTLFKIAKFLNAFPVLDDKEKELVMHATDGKGQINAVRHMRERTGMRLKACHDIIKAWMRENCPDKLKE